MKGTAIPGKSPGYLFQFSGIAFGKRLSLSSGFSQMDVTAEAEKLRE